MKNFKSTLFLYCLFFSSSFSLIAQDVQITESTSLYEQIENTLAPLDMSVVTTQILYDKGMDFYDYVDHVFEYMDLSQVPTGMLAERALGLIPLDRFDGQTLSDSSELNFIFFNRIYYMMYAAAISNNILPHPDIYYDAMGNDTVPLGILLFDYAHIRPDVIDAGILDTLDGQFVPVTGNTSSPYLQKKLCAVHPMTERLVGAHHEFVNIARSRTLYSSVPGIALVEQTNNNFSQSKSNSQNDNIPVLEVKIFPNPTSGELNIKTNSEQSIIRIMDLHGRVKVTFDDGLDYQINTQSWAAGIYIVEIMDKITMEVMQQKVVVQP